jgi:hypothetical protein
LEQFLVHLSIVTFTLGYRAEIFHVGAHSSAHDLHSGSRLLMPTLESFLVLVFASFCCMYLALSVISICFLCAGWICLSSLFCSSASCCFSFSVCNFPIPVVMILGNASSCYVRSLVHFVLASVLYLKPSLFFLCLISAANLWVVITLTLCL